MKGLFERAALWMILGLLVWWEGLNQPGLPHEGDALLHAYRALEMARMWRAGILYPRWAPDLAGGAGYPLFVFHAPLFPWAVATLSVGLGFSIDQAMKAVLMIATLMGSLGIYALARRWGLSQAAAMTTGLAFGYMPFQLQQTNYPQYLAITLIPWLLLSIDLALRNGGFSARWLLALTVALLGLTHNLTAMMGYWLAFTYALAISLTTKVKASNRWRTLLAFGLGIGMALPYLGPSITDLSLVHLERARTGVYEATRHFLTLPQLLRLPPLYDDRWGNRPLTLTIGLHQFLLALPALIRVLVEHRRSLRVKMIWGWAAAGAMVYLMMPISRPLWATLHFLTFAQFPWRWLGPLGVIIALLIGFSIDGAKPSSRWPIAFAASILLILGTLGFIYDGGSRVSFNQRTIADLHQYEREMGYPGLTATGELFPKWVEGWPEPSPDIAEAYQRGDEPSRLDQSVLPPDVRVRTLRRSPLDQSWEVDTPYPLSIRFWVLGYPGWTVIVDGKPAPAWIEARTGWIWAEIPAGSHQVRLRFQGRWLWFFVDLLALGLWLGWPIWAALQCVRKKWVPSSQIQGNLIKDHPRGEKHALLVFLLVIGFHLPYHLWARTRVPLDHPPGADRSIQADFEGRIRLVGYLLDRWTVKPGEKVRLTLWWRALADLEEDVHVYVHGIAADRFATSQQFQSDHVHPGDVPTRRWDPEKHYRDEHILTIPRNIQAGPYRIRIGLYGGPRNERWRIADRGADGIDLPQVLVVSRAIPLLPSPVTFGDQIQLQGMEQPTLSRAGQPIDLWFDWKLLKKSINNYTLFVHALDENGQLVAQADLFQLTSMWPVQTSIPLRVTLPPLPAGRYRVRIGWYLWPTMEHLPALTASGIAPGWESPFFLEVQSE